jgi:hypothetical protein
VIWRLLAANALLLVAGAGLLPLVGAARTPRQLAARLGLGWLVGLAAGGVLAALLALAGVAAGWLFLAVFAGVCAAAGALRLRPEKATVCYKRGALVGLVAAALLIALLVHAGLSFVVAPLLKFDSWFIWTSKAKAIADLGGAPASVFGDQAGVYLPHLEYPLLLPALESLDFRVMGAQDVQAMHLQLLLFAPAGIAALASLLYDIVPPLALAAAALAVGAAPSVLGELRTAYADLPLALVFAAGAVAAARWLVTGERWPLASAAIFLGAAAWTKNEGTLFAAAALVALALAAGRRGVGPVAALAAATIAIALPWRIYTAVHGIRSEDYRFSDTLRWQYVTGRLGRGPIAVRSLAHSLFAPSHWALLVPLFLVACAAALAAGSRRLPLYGLLLGLLGLAGLVWIYVISPLELPDYLGVTSERVIASLVLAGAALSPLLVSEALAPGRRPTPRSRRRAR